MQFHKTSILTFLKNNKITKSRVKGTKVKEMSKRLVTVHQRSPHSSQSYALNRSRASKRQQWRKINFKKTSCKWSKGQYKVMEHRISMSDSSSMLSCS